VTFLFKTGMAKKGTFKVDDKSTASIPTGQADLLNDLPAWKAVDNSNANNLNVKVICGFLPLSNNWVYRQVLKSSMPDIIVRGWSQKNE
jgi:hypothetical protein